MGKKATLYLIYWLTFALTLTLAIFTIIAGKFNLYFPAGILSVCVLMLPVLIVLHIVVAIYWLIRWRWFFLIPVLAVISNYDYFGTVYRSGEKPDDSSLYKKISYYNMRIVTFKVVRRRAGSILFPFKAAVPFLAEM